MIQLNNISKEFGDRILFYGMTFSLNKGEKVGLVGRNGTGKSTLLKLITGELSPEEGDINIPRGYKISTLDQHIFFTEPTILQECALALSKDEQYDIYKAEKILSGLGFSEEDFHKTPDSFSGGYQVRVQLAKCLLGNPDLLLLDEPTNYLDILSLRWFQRFLKTFPGEVILITHDRDFMNSVTTHTMGISHQKLKKIPGDFFKYKEQIEEEKRVLDGQRANQERKRKQIELFITKFRAKASKATQAGSKMKMLERMGEFEKLEDEKDLHFKFNYKDFPAKTHFKIENLDFGYDPSNLLIKDFSFALNRGEKIAIIGKNGKGKSTLLNLIAGNLKPVKGSLDFHKDIEIGYFGQTNIDRLHADNNIEQEIIGTASDLPYTKVRNVCGTMMFSQDDSKKLIKVLSGGERSRVLLAKILIKPCNLLLLDEPTNHLDQESVESLSEEINNFKGGVLFVTHSEDLIKKIATKLIIFRHDKVELFDGNYNQFLEKIGWDNEEIKTVKKSSFGKKELQKMKFEIKKKYSTLLKPLTTQFQEAEAKISVNELKVKELEASLIKYSEAGEGSKITDCSRELDQAQQLIEELFSKLEELDGQIESIKSQQDSELESLYK